ncbi:putative glutamine amidotransferase [Amycolatopsis bartoniae]|uniref:gamma-glutamyl-gamma-aminobutyrate hydrolase family protein n=1 Tax=Amycolatopsis bartoniae TaxID=941986 RepID=UPI00160650E4|nr:gamma-glutamyl-gamma-aminobutyrate hydrolase family protein [Amycolatopsis bartoniae]MBB2933526.1 putative glutamine amidotransferase [Amycolatopsis bartoniae]
MTQRIVVDPVTGEIRLALDVRWARFLAAAGLIPVPLPLEAALARQVMRAAGCAGLLLTGGNDLGEVPERDELELSLLAAALARRLPVLGVCRGMQLILSAFGGVLQKVEGHVGVQHRLADGRVVNSYHNWGAVEAPREFTVTARHEGVVEAIRHRVAPVVGTMWHPERTDPFDPADLALFTELFRSSDESRHPGRGAWFAHGRPHVGPAEVPAGDRREDSA